MTTPKQQNESLTICKHGKDGYCFDCVRERRNQDMLDGRFDDAEQQNEERVPPERVWLELERYPDGLEWNVTFRGLPPPAHRANAVGYVRADLAAAGAVSLTTIQALAIELAELMVDDPVCDPLPQDFIDSVTGIVTKRLATEAVSIPDAISVVERWRDETDRPTDQLVAAELIIDRLRSSSPSVGVGIEDAESRLIRLAAAMLQGHRFLSPCADDYHKQRVSRRTIIDAAQGQREQLRKWAIELREIADELRAKRRAAAQTKEG